MREYDYFKAACKVTAVEVELETTPGKKAKKELDAVKKIIAMLHANMVRCGCLYTMRTDDTVYVRDFLSGEKVRLSIPLPELKNELSEDEYRRFIEEIQEDGRIEEVPKGISNPEELTIGWSAREHEDVHRKNETLPASKDNPVTGNIVAPAEPPSLEEAHEDSPAEPIQEDAQEEPEYPSAPLEVYEYDIDEDTGFYKRLQEKAEELGQDPDLFQKEEKPEQPADQDKPRGYVPKSDFALFEDLNMTSDQIRPIITSEKKKPKKSVPNPNTTVTERLTEYCEDSVLEVLLQDQLLMTYLAVIVSEGERRIGAYEFYGAPLDPGSKTGKFVFCAKRSGSLGRPYRTVSETVGRTEEVTYRIPNENMALKFSPVVRDRTFRLAITPVYENGRDIRIDVASEKTLGNYAHCMYLDEENDCAIHLFPMENENNEAGKAAMFGVIENENLTTFDIPEGEGIIEVDGESYTVKGAWDEETFITQLI